MQGKCNSFVGCWRHLRLLSHVLILQVFDLPLGVPAEHGHSG